tara:strand:- start:208 stop:417 length:210 start_codon:yes stop_codon:yes gene_type:complete
MSQEYEPTFLERNPILGCGGVSIGALAFSVSLILSVSWLGSQVSCSDGRTGGGGQGGDEYGEDYRGWRE